jgi:D-alanyl-D-alanine carboxypeptidase
MLEKTNVPQMPTLKQKISILIIIVAATLPNFAAAQAAEINAKAYVIINPENKQIIAAQNADLPWTAASLTKLVTALVVLDTKPKLDKAVAITKADRTIGSCNDGGVCLKAVAGAKFTVEGLFHATLMRSANDAANALARSTGLTSAQFAKKMNAKVKALGATKSVFYEPTGMNPKNKITALDYTKIIAAAFEQPYLQSIAQLESYDLVSTNNSKYTQVVKNTNKLLASTGVELTGSKTGYLPESKYNLASILKYNNGQKMIVVVLGEPHMYMAYDDTTFLANLVNQSLILALAK